MPSDPVQQTFGEPIVKCPPLFRWAGGKRRLLAQILPLLPKKFNRYYEPFCGGAALFFELRPQNATLGDKNADLINCYQQVKLNPEKVIAGLQKLKNSEDDYYRVRDKRPTSAIGRAVRFIYLMELSFNGIYRVNSEGDFNVPYCYKERKKFDFEKIRNVSRGLSNVELLSSSFSETVKEAKEGDLIYFDPPYTVAHCNNGFVQYNEKIFSWDDQTRLAKLASELAERGCHVLVSNADHVSIAGIYPSFSLHILTRFSGVGGLRKTRKHITEFLFMK